MSLDDVKKNFSEYFNKQDEINNQFIQEKIDEINENILKGEEEIKRTNTKHRQLFKITEKGIKKFIERPQKYMEQLSKLDLDRVVIPIKKSNSNVINLKDKKDEKIEKIEKIDYKKKVDEIDIEIEKKKKKFEELKKNKIGEKEMKLYEDYMKLTEKVENEKQDINKKKIKLQDLMQKKLLKDEDDLYRKMRDMENDYNYDENNKEKEKLGIMYEINDYEVNSIILLRESFLKDKEKKIYCSIKLKNNNDYDWPANLLKFEFSNINDDNKHFKIENNIITKAIKAQETKSIIIALIPNLNINKMKNEYDISFYLILNNKDNKEKYKIENMDKISINIKFENSFDKNDENYSDILANLKDIKIGGKKDLIKEPLYDNEINIVEKNIIKKIKKYLSKNNNHHNHNNYYDDNDNFNENNNNENNNNNDNIEKVIKDKLKNEIKYYLKLLRNDVDVINVTDKKEGMLILEDKIIEILKENNLKN